jgi:hypothetical protein
MPRGRLIRLSSILLVTCSLVAHGCTGGDLDPHAPDSALVVGAASGPIFDELASAYRLSPGDGTEPADGYDVAIYDGRSLTPEQIASLPSTDGFLRAGKILIVLDPDIDDLQALEGELGAAPLVDTPAVAVFKTYSSDRSLQNATVIEFPTVLEAESAPDDGASPASDAVQTIASRAPVDDATLREQAAEWRKLYESDHQAAERAMRAQSGSTGERLAAAASADGDTAPVLVTTAAAEGDVPPWLAAPESIPPASTSPYWTVRQFTHTRPVSFAITSALYEPENQGIKRDGSAALQRGLCFFVPDGSTFTLKQPATRSTATALITHVVNRLLQETGPGTYSHNIIARQFIRSSPTVVRPDAPIGTETVNFCRALNHNGWSCVENGFGCNSFREAFDLQSLLGFNARIMSNLAWDPATAALLSVSSMRPLAANKVSTVTTSENWSLGVNWSIQGSIDIESVPPQVALSGPGAGGSASWGWSSTQNINVVDWETRPLSSGATATHDLFAAGGGNNLANLSTFTEKTGNGLLSYTALTGLQESLLEARTETSWITTGATLPPGKATLTSQVELGYGEVYDRFSAVNDTYPAPLPYSALHVFKVALPMEFDFAQPILQPPVRATWSITADLMIPPNAQGFFPVRAVVTLDEEAAADTTIQLGAEIYSFGNSQPAPSVIRDLPTRVTIRKGQSVGKVSFLARKIGTPYNVRVWAFRTNGQQVAFPMTVPAS